MACPTEYVWSTQGRWTSVLFSQMPTYHRSLTGFTLSFTDSVFDLIQLDSNDVESQPQASSAGMLYPGQRMDAILIPSSGGTRHKQKSMTIKLDEE